MPGKRKDPGYLSWLWSVEDLRFQAIRHPPTAEAEYVILSHNILSPKWPKESAK